MSSLSSPLQLLAYRSAPGETHYLSRPNSRSRRKMQGVANVSFLAMFVMYLLAALFGYLTFNSEFPKDTEPRLQAQVSSQTSAASCLI